MDKKGRVLAIIVLLLFALYMPLNFASSTVYSFKTVVDDFIPLLTPFVIVYISYFVFLAVNLIYFAKLKKPVVINALLLSIAIACLSAYTFYLFFQNSVDRPLIQSENIFDDLYLLINANVPPYNAFPSLHVAISLICAAGYFAIKSKYQYQAATWVALIILSTVVTKQHYFLDVVGGFLLAAFSYQVSKLFLK
jgi:membrane-associated phospholipid phosphatase